MAQQQDRQLMISFGGTGFTCEVVEFQRRHRGRNCFTCTKKTALRTARCSPAADAIVGHA